MSGSLHYFRIDFSLPLQACLPGRPQGLPYNRSRSDFFADAASQPFRGTTERGCPFRSPTSCPTRPGTVQRRPAGSLPPVQHVQRRAARPLPRVHRRQAPHPLPGAGRGDPRAARRQERHPEHADRLRQVARRVGDALRRARARAARRLHLPDQGAGQREVDGAVPRVRPGPRRPLDRRRDRQPRRADPLLHRRGPRQHRAARRRRRRRRRRGDGRVPLLRRPRARRRLAGAAAHDAAGALPADVGDARRHAVLRGRASRALNGRADGHGEVRRSPGAARVRLLARSRCAQTIEKLVDEGKTPVYVVHFTQADAAGSAQDFTSLKICTQGAEGRDRGADRRLRVQQPVRRRHPQVAAARHRPAPRGAAPEVPRARRAARAGGTAEGDLRHGHARRGHQRADPHGAVHAAVQVRRPEDRPS